MKDYEERISQGEVLSILKKRRSCRKYATTQITEEELEVILQAGNAAPVARNRVGNIKIIVIQNKDLLDELEATTRELYAQMGMEISAIYNAPTLIMVATKKLEGAYEKGMYCSAACILENMILVATEMNLGNVFLSGVTTALNSNLGLMNKIGIPEGYEAAAAVAIGKAEDKLLERDLSHMRFEVERK